jgi:hypothetical protein
MHKGQVSIYFSVGLILIILIGIYLISQYNAPQTKNDGLNILDLESQRMSEYAESCLKNVAYDGLSKKIALQGGYLSVEGKATVRFQEYDVPFWNEDKLDKSPSLQDIENASSEYIMSNISECIRSFKPKNEGILINYPSVSESSVKTSFDDEDTKLILTYPILLQMGLSEKRIDQFVVKLNLKFKKNYELAKNLLNEIIQAQPGFYDIRSNCVNYPTNGYIHIYGFDLNMSLDDKLSVIGVYDYEPTIHEQAKAFRLLFAIKNLNQLGYCG